MMSNLNVLSLFDGMSCGQIALRELGIKVNKYYACEIDKHAIRQTQLNFPDTIQLGNVVDLDVGKLDPIQLLIGGSPCTNFSFVGKRNGMSTTTNEEIYTLERYLCLKERGFQFEGQSYLFWEYMRILIDIRKYNPDVKFLLENVEMAKKWERVLSEAIGVYGVHINSALVSAQSRKRIYWANFEVKQMGLFGDTCMNIPQPKDRGIFLKDILEEEVDEKYYIKNPKFGFEGMDTNGKGNTLRIGGSRSQSQSHNYDIIKIDTKGNVKPDQKKASCFTAGGDSGGNLLIAFNCDKKTYLAKSGTLLARYGKGMSNFGGDTFIYVSQRIRNQDNPTSRKVGLSIMQLGRGFNKGGSHENKSPTLSSSSWEQNNLLVTSNYLQVTGGFDSNNRYWFEDGKHATCTTRGFSKTGVLSGARIRRLTPKECSRLQTIPEWYIWQCSDSQRYRMLGNGWTIEVIKHILSYL